MPKMLWVASGMLIFCGTILSSHAVAFEYLNSGIKSRCKCMKSFSGFIEELNFYLLNMIYLS
jgi:hypothetical protein